MREMETEHKILVSLRDESETANGLARLMRQSTRRVANRLVALRQAGFVDEIGAGAKTRFYLTSTGQALAAQLA
jgi:hypothetical protein